MCLTHRRVIVVISPFWKTNQANTVLAKKQLPCKNISLGNSLPITIQPSASICTNQWHLQNKWKVSIAALSKCNCPCFPISILVPLDPPDYSPKTPLLLLLPLISFSCRAHWACQSKLLATACSCKLLRIYVVKFTQGNPALPVSGSDSSDSPVQPDRVICLEMEGLRNNHCPTHKTAQYHHKQHHHHHHHHHC